MIVSSILYLGRMVTFLMSMFISRLREFRADATAVRLTRDPLSLAEALYLIDTNLHGTRISGKNLSAIFIVSPKKLWFEEEMGFFADLFSTHPPIKERLKILLDIAHSDISLLRNKFLGKFY